MQLHPKQQEVVRSRARFKVVRAGRKGGKTALEIETICYKALISAKKLGLTKTTFNTGRKVLYIAPTQKQARNIIWGALKNRLHGIGIANEALLEMKVPNEDGEMSSIYVGGWENRENYRGFTDVIHISVDETDTLRNFHQDWREIFRPMFLDTGGTADFIGTPKKENQNLRRLEKEAENKPDWDTFHFTSKDNPYISMSEIEAIEQEFGEDREAYRQEVLAEYVDNSGALIKFSSLIDVFTNTVTKGEDKYLIVDVAEQGSDKTVISYWESLEEVWREEYKNLNTEAIIGLIRDYTVKHRIPMSHVAVDAIGVGAGVASSSLLSGVISYKSSYAPIKTDRSIVHLPNVHMTKEAPLTSDYKNLRSQCVFELARHINEHKIASRVSGDNKDKIIEELVLYQDASLGDGKRLATTKEEVKEMLGHSPDHSDTWIMRMYFEIVKDMMPNQDEDISRAIEIQRAKFARNRENQQYNSTR